MGIRRPSVAVAVLALVFAAGVAGTRADEKEDRAAKEKKARRLLEVSGSEKVSQQSIDTMVAMFSKNPQLPPGFAKKFKELADPKELCEMLVPIYVANLGDDELDAAIAFYESPAGQKFAAAQPAIQRDSSKAGEKWGAKLGMRVIQALQEDKQDKKGKDKKGKEDEDEDK